MDTALMVVKIGGAVDPDHEEYVPISIANHWFFTDATECNKRHIFCDFLRDGGLDAFSFYRFESKLVAADGHYTFPGKLADLQYLVCKGCFFLGCTARKAIPLLVPHEFKRENRLELVAINRLGLRQ